MSDDSLYDLLGVPEEAPASQIHEAYRRLIKQVHPDHGGSSVLFREVQSAYQTLADPQRRALYDRTLHGPPRPSPAATPPPRPSNPQATQTPPGSQDARGRPNTQPPPTAHPPRQAPRSSPGPSGGESHQAHAGRQPAGAGPQTSQPRVPSRVRPAAKKRLSRRALRYIVGLIALFVLANRIVSATTSQKHSAETPTRSSAGVDIRWSPAINVDPGHGLYSVSCPSPTMCLALDGATNVFTFSGIGWSRSTTLASAAQNSLDKVSCGTPTFCVATDNASITSFAAHVSIYNAGTWGSRQNISPNDNGAISATSCASDGFCTASIGATGPIKDYSNGTWSSVITSASGFSTVSCVSSSFCAAADYSGLAYVFNGTRWTNGTEVDANKYGIVALSCATPSFCVGVDHYGDAYQFNGRRWSGPRTIDPIAGLDTVSCPTVDFCLAGDIDGHVVIYHDGTWSPPYTIDTNHDNGLMVSCGSASLCVAVDDGGKAFVGRRIGP